MRSVIDTNVLIFDSVEDSAFHTEAEKLLESLKTWYIPTIVLYEFVFVLANQKINALIIRELLDQYIQDPRAKIINITGKHIIDALNLIVKENISPKEINDKTILLVAKELRAPLATFDLKLRKQAKKLNIETLPK